jgi:hypothetical protein
MKSRLIRHQHLAMKLGIFIIGIATGFEASARQLALQCTLFLVFMLFEPQLYAKLLFALRKFLFFLTAYWLFATIFAMDFMASLLFSARILYLLLVMVYTWGSVDKKQLIYQSRICLRFALGRIALSYIISTFYFMREYLNAYRAIPRGESIQSILNRAIDAGQMVHAQSPNIALKVEADLNVQSLEHPTTALANVQAAGFLFLLVMVHNL